MLNNGQHSEHSAARDGAGNSAHAECKRNCIRQTPREYAGPARNAREQYTRSVCCEQLRSTAKAMLDEAERTMVNLLRGEAGTVEGERFSIQQDANGKPYVLIDTDQDIFEGKSVDECARIARMYMKEHFQGRVMDVGDSRAFVSRRSVNEYTHPANHRLPLDIKVVL